ncbi:MAG: hypothetical protein ACOH5I_08870 [Oligoflexus sp.]
MIKFTKFILPVCFLATASISLAKEPSKGDVQARITEIKQEIKQIARENIDRTDNFLEVRNQLQPLVNEIVELSPNRLEAEKLDQVVGAWRNLWSDQEFGPGTDPKQVYQSVSPDGYYYNISLANTPRGEFTNFLRGAYNDEGSYLRIEFTDNALTEGFYEPGTEIFELAEDFEAGKIEANSIPGPIGVKGVLINLYVDEDLRIVTGNSTSDSALRLFVLERVESISFE